MQNTQTIENTHSLLAQKASRWSVQDLVVIGVFSAAAKISSILVTIMGGGPNPIGFIAKNLIFTTMLVVMLYRVRKELTLSLFVCINLIISMLLLGASVTSIATALGAALIAEGIVYITGGIQKSWGPVLAVAIYDILFKVFSLFATWLYSRENPAMLIPVIIIVSIGYIGAFLGLFVGVKTVKELKHAGIIRE